MSNINWNKVLPPKGEKDESVWNFEDKSEMIGEYIKVEDNVGPNNSKMYYFKSEDGIEIKVWGCTVLDMRMKQIEPKTIVKIEYLGKEKNPKNGRSYKNFDVYVGEYEN